VYILTILDLFSKWAEGIPLRNKEAVTVGRALFDVCISRLGFPIQILSDNGLEFESSVLRELCRLSGIDKVRTTSYKPSTNGAVERFHRTLNSMLGKIVSDHQRDWDERLPTVMSAYRASNHSATGLSPNFLMLGRETRAPIDLLYGVPPEELPFARSYDSYVDHKVEIMRDAYEAVRQSLCLNANRMTNRYNLRVRPKQFNVGCWVYYYNPRRYVGKSPKWQKMFTGPFLVVRCIGPVNVVLQLSKRARPFVSHVDKLKPCLGPTPVSWLDAAEEAEDTTKRVERQEIVYPESGEETCLLESGSEFAPVTDEQLVPVPRRGGRQIRPPQRYGYD